MAWRSNKRRCFAGSTRSQPINLRESVKGDIQNFAIMAKVQRRGAKQSGGVEFFIINPNPAIEKSRFAREG
jgi:hypothetical protein